jgi:DNA-binding protein H-NS
MTRLTPEKGLGVQFVVSPPFLVQAFPFLTANFTRSVNETKVESSPHFGFRSMTQSYKQIQKQIETLQRQAEKLRKQEIDGVIARIKVAIAHYGLTAQQLGLGAAAGGVKAKAKAAKAVPTRSAKYSDGQGNTWSGIGKRPYWLRDALDAGRTLEEFATGSLSPAPKSAKSKTSKKRKSKVVYRDQAGHTWSGMGPRPRWLKEALDAGKTLEEMTA